MVDKIVFAQRLRVAIEQRGTSQEELAKKLKLAPGTISKYINAKYAPRGKRIEQIAQILDVPVGWLIGALDRLEKPTPTLKIAPTDNPPPLDEGKIYAVIRKRQKELFMMQGVPESDAERLVDLTEDLKSLSGTYQLRAAQDYIKSLAESSEKEGSDEPTQ